ncbi:hypothetical protein EDB85DRAFT_1977665 [Lactarius pseudohatsudake]|nr:hypothetical protein EDB85DRAFT_1977665 [Lactarius pseudohatsudake]
MHAAALSTIHLAIHFLIILVVAIVSYLLPSSSPEDIPVIRIPIRAALTAYSNSIPASLRHTWSISISLGSRSTERTIQPPRIPPTQEIPGEVARVHIWFTCSARLRARSCLRAARASSIEPWLFHHSFRFSSSALVFTSSLLRLQHGIGGLEGLDWRDSDKLVNTYWYRLIFPSSLYSRIVVPHFRPTLSPLKGQSELGGFDSVSRE